jgi:hypothetical protein
MYKGIVAFRDDAGHVVAKLLELGPVHHPDSPVTHRLVEVRLVSQLA